jgi:hypothetical protein
MFRMSSDQFLELCSLLKDEIHETNKLPVVVQVAIFLDWVCFGTSYRKQRAYFKVSHELINTARRNVADAIVKIIYPLYVKQPNHVPDINNPKLQQFHGVFGCVDGCHIPVQVPVDCQRQWRNRKGWTSVNALAICRVDSMLFTYALFGAEGPAPDSSILERFAAQEIRWLQDAFLLADAGFGLSKRVLTPFRGVRYHLKEFSEEAGGRPQNAKELFNLRHASMR